VVDLEGDARSHRRQSVRTRVEARAEQDDLRDVGQVGIGEVVDEPRPGDDARAGAGPPPIDERLESAPDDPDARELRDRPELERQETDGDPVVRDALADRLARVERAEQRVMLRRAAPVAGFQCAP
jgi:hypothetical protein